MGDPLEQISYGADGCSRYFFLADRAELPYRRFDRAGFSNRHADDHRYPHCHGASHVYARAANRNSNRHSAASVDFGATFADGSPCRAESFANNAPRHARANGLSFACATTAFRNA